ncbi:MAG TPA: carbamoyltransferase C-terminal domain-containing protein [Dehalococcoidia bacterium]|nr:carbamoyltransferase C-terminal domain-containing protein [Dehalococcoidia bacterium]
MYVLGINAAFHDSSAALLKDGVPVAAAEEERFTRIKHAKRPVPFLSYQLPFHAIAYCLREAGIRLAQVDRIAYSFDPRLMLGERDPGSVALPLEPSAAPREDGLEAWEPLFLAGVLNAPRFLLGDIPHHLSHLREGVDSRDDLPPFEFVEHHLAHAASAYYVSGFRQAAILTLDGRGERTTTMYAVGKGTSIAKLQEVPFPHSLGLLYEKVTEHLGFLHSSDEYKVMALASLGSGRFLKRFQRLVELGEDGRYRVAEPDLETEFGPRRKRGERLEQRHFDLATALQKTLEETALKMTRWLKQRSGLEELCLAGGVALNCVMNARIRDEGPFQRVFVQPAAGDAGTALGAAYVVEARERGQAVPFVMEHAYLGPCFSEEEIHGAIERARLPYRQPPDIAEATAELLAGERIMGWFQGRMEFGPRALGARSILASPLAADMKDRLNEIKDREDFRPVAPAVLEERLEEYFETQRRDPFMLFVARVRPDKEHLIPAVRHIDGTARVQTVAAGQAPLFHRLIEGFQARTGVPVLVNTSFNTLGRPIVCTPEDALECFYTSPLDALAIGPFLLEKGS